MGALLTASWRLGSHLNEPPAGTSAACACESARQTNGWCEACQHGYVAGLEIRSKPLFDGLDAHGHDLDPAVMACETCKALMRTGGYCEACRFGWVGGQAYMSRLTFHLALGRTCDPSGLACETCRTLAGGVGWCEACGGGWTGTQFFEERADYEAAAHEFAKLRAAIEVSARCDTCALVLLVDGTCPYCHITYRDGKTVAGGG